MLSRPAPGRPQLTTARRRAGRRSLGRRAVMSARTHGPMTHGGSTRRFASHGGSVGCHKARTSARATVHRRARLCCVAPSAAPPRPEETSMNEPGKIRNVALVGHRGTGKTSLLEALAVSCRSDQPPGQDRRRQRRSATGTTTKSAGSSAWRRRLPTSSATASPSTSSTRPATPASRPTPSAPCASSKRRSSWSTR